MPSVFNTDTFNENTCFSGSYFLGTKSEVDPVVWEKRLSPYYKISN